MSKSAALPSTSALPDAGLHYRRGFITTCSSRVRQVGGAGSSGGDLFAMYRIYALSTLSYVTQFEEVKSALRQQERAAIARILRALVLSLGPGGVTNLRLLGARSEVQDVVRMCGLGYVCEPRCASKFLIKCRRVSILQLPLTMRFSFPEPLRGARTFRGRCVHTSAFGAQDVSGPAA